MTTKVCRPALKRPSTDRDNGVFKGQLLGEVWKTLQPIMTRIFDGEELKNGEYMSLYSLVYDFCSCGDSPSSKSGRYTGPHILKESTWELTLYKKIEDFIIKKIKTVEPLLVGLDIRDENQILQHYVKYANGYFIGTRQLNGICKQLNNHMMKMVSENSDFHHIEHLAYMCWKRGIFSELGNTVTKSILGLIEKERNGEIIQSENIIAVIASLIKIGYEPKEVKKIKERMKTPEVMQMSPVDQDKLYKNLFETMELSSYKALFEATFSKNTSEWFENKKKFILATSDTSLDYVNAVSSILREELARVKKNFHPSTANSVIDIIVRIAVSGEREKFFDAIPEIFEICRLKTNYQYDMISDLLRDSDQFCSVNAEDKDVLLKKFKAQVCIEIDKRLEEERLKAQKIVPVAYMDAFQNTYSSFITLIKQASLSEVFKTTLQKAIIDAFDINVVTRTKKVKDYSETTFAFRLHCILRSKQGHDKVEESCNKLMALFHMLPNQISFEYRYRTYLVLRIAEKSSVSNELEASLITRMQAFGGFGYGVNLTKLLQEGTVISTDLLHSFKQSVFWDKKVSFNFDITMFSGNSCPWSSATETPTFIIPLELSPVYVAFQNFHLAVRPNQKLQWLHSRSKGELETSYLKKKYILVCSVYQMAVMLLFNAGDSLSFEDIVTQTGLTKEEAAKVVLQLAGSELLLLERKGAGNSMNNEDVIKLNLGFASKSARVPVNAAVKIEQEQKDDDKASKDAGLATSFAIQATIVRVMKANQKLTHSALVSEVIADTIKSRKCMVVPVSTIKAAIETLIEQDFIKRLDDDMDSYQYIS